MVPSGELHIAAVDYSHTHHPYFCIVKHRFSSVCGAITLVVCLLLIMLISMLMMMLYDFDELVQL